MCLFELYFTPTVCRFEIEMLKAFENVSHSIQQKGQIFLEMVQKSLTDIGYCSKLRDNNMFYNSGNLTITLICTSIGFIVSIIYSNIRSRKVSEENEILIRNVAKQWVEDEKNLYKKVKIFKFTHIQLPF